MYSLSRLRDSLPSTPSAPSATTAPTPGTTVKVQTTEGALKRHPAILPSTAAADDILDGYPGAWPRFIGLTLLRTVILVPGIVVAGVRKPGRVALGAITTSVIISALCMVDSKVYHERRQDGLAGRYR